MCPWKGLSMYSGDNFHLLFQVFKVGLLVKSYLWHVPEEPEGCKSERYEHEDFFVKFLEK